MSKRKMVYELNHTGLYETYKEEIEMIKTKIRSKYTTEYPQLGVSHDISINHDLVLKLSNMNSISENKINELKSFVSEFLSPSYKNSIISHTDFKNMTLNLSFKIENLIKKPPTQPNHTQHKIQTTHKLSNEAPYYLETISFDFNYWLTIIALLLLCIAVYKIRSIIDYFHFHI